ncbi:MAG: hypothetical protein EZS28_010411 [Streblomastix strix]|uniref:Uncharacterized protein n=1 Tax=Streblomastix strix TaxID=222440 RepID=A0A5J4WIC6_9EUKA|nr:MAG: hypothetical protein EZS28_010411 [Streblomastix strix]
MDALLLLNANVADVVNSYSKTEDDAFSLLKTDKSDTYSKSEDDTLLLLKADKSELIDVYLKTEDDALLLMKANVADIVYSYSKIEDDALLLLKINKSDPNSKSEDDAQLLLKADKSELIDAYSKSETDTLLDTKADKSQLIDLYSKSEYDTLLIFNVKVAGLTNYIDLTSAHTITGKKQFGVISVSSISNLSKNDAFIFLAGGGDTFVNSLVAQLQQQEIREIASGKSKAYVLSTQGELNGWMCIQDNVAKLVIADNLYIVDKEVTDYWQDGTN